MTSVTTYATTWMLVSRPNRIVPNIEQLVSELCFVPFYTCVTLQNFNSEEFNHGVVATRHLGSPTFAPLDDPVSAKTTCFEATQLQAVEWASDVVKWSINVEYMALFGCSSEDELINHLLLQIKTGKPVKEVVVVVVDEEIDTDNLRRQQATSYSIPTPPLKSSFKKKRKVRYADQEPPTTTTTITNDAPFDENDPETRHAISMITWIWGVASSVIGRFMRRSGGVGG